MTPVDGWFEISTPAQLLWWSHYAAKHLDASAKLMDDINMEDYSDRWAQVGTEGKPFYGNFDGQYHTISNLNVDMPNNNGVGLISVMNSLPSKGFGGLNDEQARNAEGVYIKNVVLDESCTLKGKGYVALVGMTAPWAGHVNITGVMMCGNVEASDGPNAAGVFGCVMGSACHVTIDNCGMVGNVKGSKENGSFSGWLGDWAEVTNCFAVGSVEGIESNERYFARYGDGRVNDNIKNCYALHGTQEHVGIVSEQDFNSGALAWKANGEQFRTGYWFQNIGDDPYPFPDSTHGTVIYAAEEYYSVYEEEEIVDLADIVKSYEQDKVAEVIATQALLDDYNEYLESLTEVETIIGLADAFDTITVWKDSIAANAAVYDSYIKKCDEIKASLENDQSFSGSIRDALEYYLNDADEPSEDNPLGTYEYIKEMHLATAEEINAEKQRVIDWYAAAIAQNVVPGTDISNLIPNYDFSQKNEKWEGGFGTGWGEVPDTQTGIGKVIGVEAWDKTGDMYQTIEEMQPGYYLVGTHAAFRPSDNRYSTNYAAGIYANGIFNYFPAIVEDIVEVNDTIDQENCNLHGAGVPDLEIYKDYNSTSADEGAELIGYATRGETGIAAAANANRYQVYTIAKVGEDGKLTIGIKNPGTQYGQDWTGWSALKVMYCGEDGDVADQALDLVLDNMSKRAETIINYEFSEELTAAGPNFPESLKEVFSSKVMAIESASTVEEKAQLAEELSDLFQQLYEARQAYRKLWGYAAIFEAMESSNPELVEKDPETGEYISTQEYLYNEDELTIFFDAYSELFDAYFAGSYSTEEALNPPLMQEETIKNLLPSKDEEGFFLISTPKDFVAYRNICSSSDSKASAKLVNSVDMTGIAMNPIGWDNEFRFRGVFDGQGLALTNLYINDDTERTGLFRALDNATVKNLKLTGEYYSSQKYTAGIAGKTYGKCVIDNCEVAVTINSAIEGDGTHGGIIGVNEDSGTVVSNCLVNCAMYGEATNSCGGVCGWATNALTVKNTLILSQDITISSENSNIVSRNDGNVTVNNVFYAKAWGGTMGALVTAEQLASGEIAYKLNGSKSDGDLKWFQAIGQDATPCLFEGAVVYYYGGKYMNDMPNPQLNAFAYNLEAKQTGSNVTVSYSLNAEAEAVEVNFYDGETLVYTAVSNEAGTVGAHKVVVPVSKLGVEDATTLNYNVVVAGKGSLDILKIGESYEFSSPYGLAVNNNPASKGFGQILVTETRPTEDHTGMFSENKPGALFAFDAGFQPVDDADGTPGFYGGLDIADKAPLKFFGEYELGFKDVRFSQDGRLFVGCASGTTNSSVYELNPDDLSEPWKPVFNEGELDEATGITYVGDEEQNRPAVGLALEGEGDDLKMYVLGVQGGFPKSSDVTTYAPAFNCAVYELGAAKEWSGAPSAYVEALDGRYAGIPTHISIHEDGRGGLWFVQSATEHSEAVPSIKHFDAEGNEDYSDAKTNTYSGMMAVTADGNYIAFGKGQNKVVIYETNYVPMEGVGLWLEPKYDFATSESSITGLAFDIAGNLYVASSGTKTLSRYVIPGLTDNQITTPGNGIVLGEGVEGDLNGDGSVDISDAVVILDAMASDVPDMKFDLNGDNAVDISDFVVILDIMAQ